MHACTCIITYTKLHIVNLSDQKHARIGEYRLICVLFYNIKNACRTCTYMYMYMVM